jgi:hypothetical protein
MVFHKSASDAVPMICPSCCTLDDIPEWPKSDAGELKLVIGCQRCGFSFPNLPGEFKELTLHALLNHRCEGPERGNWADLGNAILAAISGQGEWPELPAWPHAEPGQPGNAERIHGARMR